MTQPFDPKPVGDDRLDGGRGPAPEGQDTDSGQSQAPGVQEADAGRGQASKGPDVAGRGGAQPLRGRHVAVAGADHGAASARLFERAATALGARVSHLRPGLLVSGHARDEAAARLLGTLYDAIDGVGMSAAQALELQRLSGIPVFADLGGPASPLRAQLTAADDEAQLQALVEAALVRSLG